MHGEVTATQCHGSTYRAPLGDALFVVASIVGIDNDDHGRRPIRMSKCDPWFLSAIADAPIDVAGRVAGLKRADVGDLHTLAAVVALVTADYAPESFCFERCGDAVFGQADSDGGIGEHVGLAAEHGEPVIQPGGQLVDAGNAPFGAPHRECQCCRAPWSDGRDSAERTNSGQTCTWFQFDLDSGYATGAGDVDQDRDFFAFEDPRTVSTNTDLAIDRTPQRQPGRCCDQERCGQRQDLWSSKTDGCGQTGNGDQATDVEERQSPGQVSVTREPDRC